MVKESDISIEEVNQLAEKSTAIPVGLNRHERRALERSLERQRKPSRVIITGVINLESVDPLLEENDLLVCQQELGEYELAQEESRILLEHYRIMQAVGIPDSSVRSFVANLSEENVIQGGETALWLQAGQRKLQQNKQRVLINAARRKAFYKKTRNKVYADEDTNEIMKSLIKHEDITARDIFGEVLRARTEKVELIKLQIEWLKTQQEIEKLALAQPEEITQVEEQPIDHINFEIIPEVEATQSNYALLGWDLFWTNNHWSSETNHLVSIPTTSREDSLSCLASVARDKISVKPLSILRALEFHLQKDTIQRALSTRNKYGPEGVKDWVKIKRGHDRIFFLIPQVDQHQAIFFVAGRDVVYRGT